MAASFQLRVVTPSRLLIDEQVREVSGPGSLGEFGVLPDHITFLGALETGTLTYRTDQGQRRVAVRGGFAEVLGSVMTVLADDAVCAEDIDAAKARLDLASANEQLSNLTPVDDGFAAAQANCRWAQARLDAAGGR